ncbi:MAG: glycosyltransferase family 2 protein [Thermoleophilaceae bacterium]|nr:glycosyltransferase family 2 protein [Thermoleophilaceae bacterium]
MDAAARRGGPAPARRRCLAIVVARDEQASVGEVLGGIPGEACGMPVDTLLVDDGSRDATPSIARDLGTRVVSHDVPRGLGAAVRTGLELARDEGYAAAVYLDGDGEYSPADFERVLEPVAHGRADYVLGSRFLGERDGMTWHRTLANRAVSALLGTLMETVISDGQTGYRAFSARALRAARIRHDYNYAQVLTLSLWGAGIEPVEVPIRYRRRASGRSFVRYPEYFARVAPAIWREWRTSRRTRSAMATAMPAASQYGQPPSGSNNGSSSTSGPNGASGRSVTSSPPARTST